MPLRRYSLPHQWHSLIPRCALPTLFLWPRSHPPSHWISFFSATLNPSRSAHSHRLARTPTFQHSHFHAQRPTHSHSPIQHVHSLPGSIALAFPDGEGPPFFRLFRSFVPRLRDHDHRERDSSPVIPWPEGYRDSVSCPDSPLRKYEINEIR